MAIRKGPCLDARSDQRDILILVSAAFRAAVSALGG